MNIKLAIVAAAALGAATLSAGAASAAMPNGLSGTATAASSQAAQVDRVRYVCNEWGRCWWRPNYYGGYGSYGPRFAGPPRWHGGWHHGHGRRW
jgi:hypothetical protein